MMVFLFLCTTCTRYERNKCARARSREPGCRGRFVFYTLGPGHNLTSPHRRRGITKMTRTYTSRDTVYDNVQQSTTNRAAYTTRYMVTQYTRIAARTRMHMCVVRTQHGVCARIKPSNLTAQLNIMIINRKQWRPDFIKNNQHYSTAVKVPVSAATVAAPFYTFSFSPHVCA